ncbi:methyl-accepting chemotaxis protein [Roseateles sp. DB2]|uniref:methyl-accepting chemotaxis protein n=1 Tax=Roseateles sp. DB2 TaxID=3453717 RepID=UPI003EE9E00A
MKSWWQSGSREPAQSPPAEGLGGKGADAQALVRSLAQPVSSLGRDAAEVRGALEDTQKVVVAQREAMQALGHELQLVQQAQQGIARATAESIEAVAQARLALQNIGTEVGGIVQTLRQVSDAASEITRIALQTRLVAFNASVEAKRAGEAGRGFGVVADAVKDLAAQVEQSSKSIMGTVGALDARIDTFSRELSSEARQGHEQSSIHAAFGTVHADVLRIAQAADQSQQTTAALADRAAELGGDVALALRHLESAFACSDRFLRLSEDLIERIASSGVRVDDALYIEGAQQAAQEIGQLLEQAVKQGRLSLQDLFDEHYQPVAGSNPQQHLARFCTLADQLFPQVQERQLQLSDKVVYCIAVDRNGYVSTHNRKYCQPQRPGDVVWNTANSRYRRIFNDRTGLASARNERPFLLQTYRRDMGGGRFVLLKEASAPIWVQGRHWGGLRLAFSF